MKSKVKSLLMLTLIFILSTCCFVACSTSDTPGDTPPGDPAKQNFSGIVFDGYEIDYDGNSHTITATGAPSDATITYTNAGPFIDAGEYDISVKVSKDGYNDYTKTAKLKINKINFTGIEFTGVTVDYDGNSYKATASGIPAFATVNYTNEGPFTDAGEYVTTLKVTNKNYNDFVKTATVKINKIDFENIEFNNETFEFDNEPHSIYIAGALPSTAQVTYTSNVQGVTNTATEIGSYTITATITEKNHNPLTLTAVLKITANDEERFMGYANNGVLYFQNALDDNAFYLYDTNTETLKKVSDGNVEDIINYQDDVMFVSKTILISAIQTASYTSSEVKKKTVYTQAGLRYIQNEGNIVYYVVNGLTNDASGIYKIDCNVNDPVPVRLSVGKAYYLQLVDNTLYFADGANGKKLSKINTTDQDQTRTLVVDEKINNLINSDGVLYYTVNKLLGNYIERYTLSNQTRRKLTIDAGESLTIVGNKLYYVNVDAFTTNLIGNGIYCVDKSPLVDCNSTGTKVIDGGSMGVCSLETDGTNLYYYDVNGYKLMQHELSSGETTNILEDFVKPADTPPLSTGSKLQYYNGNIYYLDLWDGKTLHCYNPVAQINYPLTTEKVVDFNIIGDVLYVNMVSWLVNNDVYSVNLKTGGSLEKISTYSAFEFVSDGTSIYYIEENAAGAKTAIHKCNFDGTADEIIYDKGVTNLRLVGNTLYFVDGNNIHAFNLTTKEDVIIKVDDREIHTTAFDTDGTYLYYRDMYGFLYGSKRLSRCKLDGTENIVMVSDIDPVNIVYQDGVVYYYSDTSSTAKNGLFKVSASITATTTGTTILAESSNLYAKDFVVVGDKVYFVDYKTQLVGEEHLYVLTIGESQATLIK